MTKKKGNIYFQTGDDSSEASQQQKPRLLFHLLSDTVFARIADYLDFWTLFRFCLLDDRFCRIIGEKIVARDGLDIGRISDQVDARHTLRYLGEYATKLYISESDFKFRDRHVTFLTEMFRHIGRFCTNLKTLYVIIDTWPIRFEMTNWIGFQNIEILTIKFNVGNGWFQNKGHIDIVLRKVIPKCKNLKSLTIHNISTSFEYMLFPSCPLQSLSIQNCSIVSRKNWLKAIDQHKTSLQTFDFNYSDVIGYQFNDILRHAVLTMPNITAVCAYHYGFGKFSIVPSSTLLLQFNSLSSMGFELNKTNIYILEKLAFRNIVRTVTMKFSGSDLNLTKETLEQLTRYTNLKCIRFVGGLWGKCLSVRQILNALPGLVECHFYGVYSFDFKILHMIRSPLLQRIIFENVNGIKIFKYSFNALNEQRAIICPNAPSLEIHVDMAFLKKAKAKLGKLKGSHAHFCLLERFESYK